MKLDPKRTALLTLDFQKGIFGFVPNSETVVPNAARAVSIARERGYRLIHVGLGFAPGHPEISDSESRFGRVKEANLFVKGTESAEFHPSLVKDGDLIVHKQRISAFSDNTLDMILRANRIENLIFFGISTSGIVLSTLRRAGDLDYRCVVLRDACYDADSEVHRVLTEKVFLMQATVMTVDEFAKT